MKMNLRYALLACFVSLVASCTKTSTAEEEGSIVPEARNVVAVEQELLNVVNEHRSSLGYETLEYSDTAKKYADQHTDYMIAKGNLSHDNFSARASNISTEASAEAVSENVAKDYFTAREAFEGWLKSSNHKKTMEGEFTHTAVSVKEDVSGNYYFTQLFYR
ncbi:CAP domain-containing protein [Maribacter sp. 2-571]|uniref:CAP domain-containing protein n=1 Tax=Maribacter sp. 2-571 TaxID=3417569 RepID=UPI003D3413B1